jgi:hypothetical protein
MKPWIKKVDHITYAVRVGMIEKWAWYHTEIEGGTLVTRIDDVNPGDPHSSMKLWTIDFGSFAIALVEGIDRAATSQVTAFVERHGDHSVQHVAFDTHDLDRFLEHLKAHHCQVRGETLVRKDCFGLVKQVFCKGYQDADAGEASFPEYVERPSPEGGPEAEITFSGELGKGFYHQIEEARTEGDTQPLIDFSRMPAHWTPTVGK